MASLAALVTIMTLAFDFFVQQVLTTVSYLEFTYDENIKDVHDAVVYRATNYTSWDYSVGNTGKPRPVNSLPYIQHRLTVSLFRTCS
jgi:hypothetical protein